ncbi:hypothetical protein K8I61_00100 [bacterium]|nr:hypothetical protein [bacterium]
MFLRAHRVLAPRPRASLLAFFVSSTGFPGFSRPFPPTLRRTISSFVPSINLPGKFKKAYPIYVKRSGGKGLVSLSKTAAETPPFSLEATANLVTGPARQHHRRTAGVFLFPLSYFLFPTSSFLFPRSSILVTLPA